MNNQNNKQDYYFSPISRLYVGALGGRLLSSAIAYPLAKALIKTTPSVNENIVKDFITNLKKKYNLTLTEGYVQKSGFYDDKRKMIVFPKEKIGIAAHEIGHAIDHKVNPRLFKIHGRLLFFSTPLIAGIGSVSNNDKINKLTVPTIVLASIPTLRSEAYASIKGQKELKNFFRQNSYNYKPNEIKNLLKKVKRSNLMAFGTYASLPIGSIIAWSFANKKKKKNGKIF